MFGEVSNIKLKLLSLALRDRALLKTLFQFPGKEWDYSVNLIQNSSFAHARLVVKLSPINQMTACWWVKLLTSNYIQYITVFSFDEASLNNSFAFSVRRNSTVRITLNATHK